MDVHSQYAHTTQAEAPDNLIDLGIGHPGLSLLPTELIAESARREFEHFDPRHLQYGFEQGARSFREALAAFLTRTTSTAARADELLVSGGVSQALELVCSLFTRTGDLVLTEEPTYFLALRIFEDRGLRVKSVRTDADGIDPDAVEEALSEEKPALLYTVPVHQNPSGVTLSEPRRQRLVELAEKEGFRIIADEVYHLLTYDGSPPEPFGRFAGTNRVFALGSFSKICAPGLRMGWIHAGGELIDPLVRSGFLDSGGGLAPLTSALLRSAIDDGSLEAHIDHLRAEYRARRDALLEVLAGPEGRRRGVSVSSPTGGYFVWATLPEDLSAAELLSTAREAGVGFVPGGRFSAADGFENSLRISFSYYSPQELAEGARRLLSVL